MYRAPTFLLGGESDGFLAVRLGRIRGVAAADSALSARLVLRFLRDAT
jgi:hypothetical protein